MLGAIIGDIVGSPYEFDENNIKTTEFPLFSGASHFTDDTVMTLAVAEGLMNGCASESAAEAIFLARKGEPKDTIRDYIQSKYGYDLRRTLDEIRPSYHHVESCQETMPEAIIAFLESDGFEDAIRKAVSLGGDSDTLAAITGSIAEGAYGVSDEMRRHAFSRMDGDLLSVLARWDEWMISGHDTNFPAEPIPE